MPCHALPCPAGWWVQDVMAYLRLAVSLHDDVALTRIINTPRCGPRLQACVYRVYSCPCPMGWRKEMSVAAGAFGPLQRAGKNSSTGCSRATKPRKFSQIKSGRQPQSWNPTGIAIRLGAEIIENHSPGSLTSVYSHPASFRKQPHIRSSG